MKKSIFVTVLAILSATSAYAADFGVGVEVGEGRNAIYVPINVSEGFRIEPYFSNYKSEQGDDYNSRQSELGLGLFRVSKLSDKTNLLLGARAAYAENNFYDEDMDGYSVAPVLGFEYFPVNNISLGADVSYVYTKLEDDNSDDDLTTSRTKTAINVKFYF